MLKMLCPKKDECLQLIDEKMTSQAAAEMTLTIINPSNIFRRNKIVSN